MMLQILAVSFSLAFLVESFVEYLFGEIANHVPKIAPYRWLLMYVSAIAGVGLALYYRLDLIAALAGATAITAGLEQPTQVGMVISGLAIGRGANFLHQFVSQYFPKAKL